MNFILYKLYINKTKEKINIAIKNIENVYDIGEEGILQMIINI